VVGGSGRGVEVASSDGIEGGRRRRRKDSDSTEIVEADQGAKRTNTDVRVAPRRSG